jgi:cytochrome c peroxidase
MLNKLFNLCIIPGLVLSATAVKSAPPAPVTSKESYRRPAEVPYPATNAYSKARHELGKLLFFDPRLSGSGTQSCATCHNPVFRWQDNLEHGKGDGMKTLGRRTPAIENLAWGELFFWDGRADSLEAQALGPIKSEGEMNMPLPKLIAKVRSISGYTPKFAAAYPGEAIDDTTIAKGIATFERSIVSAPAPFDRWVEGDEQAISEQAKKGFGVFTGKARCASCHSSWRFTDDSFHDIGTTTDDIGRGKLLPGVEISAYAFKTPTLRNVMTRPFYMHNGSETSIAGVIELYSQGGRQQRPSLSPLITTFSLTDNEKKQLIAFLHTLTSDELGGDAIILPQE